MDFQIRLFVLLATLAKVVEGRATVHPAEEVEVQTGLQVEFPSTHNSLWQTRRTCSHTWHFRRFQTCSPMGTQQRRWCLQTEEKRCRPAF